VLGARLTWQRDRLTQEKAHVKQQKARTNRYITYITKEKAR